MNFPKQALKTMLVKNQHKKYDKTIDNQKTDYNKWIIQQEEKIQIEEKIKVNHIRFQTKEINTDVIGKEKIEKDGKPAEKSGFFLQNETVGRSGHLKEERIYLSIQSNILYQNIEYVLKSIDTDVILLAFYEGEISGFACRLIEQIFKQNENVVLVYGDEDICKEGRREDPWFKPDWSPDSFLSFFYFGGLVAVRIEELKKTYLRCREDEKFQRLAGGDEDKVYLLLYEMLKERGGFTKGHDQEHVPVYHIKQVLFHSRENGYEQIKDMRLPGAARGPKSISIDDSVLLSIIIPSKDNTRSLFQCLDSLFERTRSNCPFEIILVDNGSQKENRSRVEKKISQLDQWQGDENGKACSEHIYKEGIHFCGFTYLYEPMEFNFSRMCNIGARAAKGKLLLFLNDDIEILEPDWMDLMVEKALLPYSGAVGAKLLYPDSSIIQHAGITNLRVGPAHKLQYLSDEEVHYFGRNRGVHNMLAVTGACLMLRRDVFEETGGFCEGLPVAFNDVDLCYTIFELGYYNIERNDVVFYHHESLSRGKDGESPQKQQRLLREKDLLYERHQDIYGKDPFYHPCLTTDMLESEYSPAYHYQVTLDIPWAEVVSRGREIGGAREDKCLVVGMESAMDIYKWQYGVSPEKGKVKGGLNNSGCYFQGYSFVIGSDNACYKRHLLLKNKGNGGIWSVAVMDRYREDIRDNLKDQLNVDLTGFTAKMRAKDVPSGVYQLGMLAEDRCSRQKLLNWSNWELEIFRDCS